MGSVKGLFQVFTNKILFLEWICEVLNQRWDLCSSCEFLTDANKCEQCGCFMKVKHKLAHASCPVGKWGKELNSIKGKKIGSLITG